MKTDILHCALFTPMTVGSWGLPLVLWGPPGTAKTSAIKSLGRRYGLHVEHLCPGERGEGAFGVTPVPEVVGGRLVLRYPPPEWVEALRPGGGEEVGIVFVDELTTAPPALQPALLGAIQERRLGGHTFGPRVRVLAAANPVAQAAGGWDLAPPVANRLGHIDWPVPDASDWADWLAGSSADIGNGEDAVAEEVRVLGLWPSAYAKASGLVGAFIRRRPELLHKMPADGDPAQSRAWPSPRTWEYATRAAAAASVHGLSEIDSDLLIAAFVGQAAAGELCAWLAQADLPDPADLLDGKVTFAADPARLDRTEAVLSACASLVAPPKAAKRAERSAALWEILAATMAGAKDVVIPAMTVLVKAGLQKGARAQTVLANAHGVVTAAGLVGGAK